MASDSFFFQKMILVEIQYKTYNDKLLAIIEVFKTWRYYLKGCKYEILILIGPDNIQHFMNIKSLNSKQVY